MTTRPSPWPHGAPCWATLATADEQRARAFYADVLGWNFRDIGPRQHDWTLAEAGGGVVAGIGAVREDGESSWLLGFATDDLQASAAAVVNAGGSLLVPPHDVLEGAAQFAVARGPGGARFGLLGAGRFAGFSAVNVPGAVVWEDAVADDPQAGRDFFTAVFGWTFTPEPRAGEDYALFGPGPDAPPWGGYGGNPHELPPYWCVWFGVDSVDAALDRVIAGDGGVVDGPGDGPWGRTARVEDPDGAVFGLMEADCSAFPDRTA